MINVSDVYDGMLKVPEDVLELPEYKDTLYKFGVIRGLPDDGWVKVEIEDSIHQYEFLLDELASCVSKKENAGEILKQKGFLWNGSKGYYARDNKDGTREVVELTENNFSYISSYANLNKIIR